MLALLALARPIDHDESQYVAAAVLAGRGLPYRDFAYLQTPLQPLLLAPLAALAGAQAWLALRLTNAALGWVTLALVARAARRAGAAPGATRLAVLALASCDIFLFGAATARNDLLPAAALAGALALLPGPPPGRARAAVLGLLLAAAAAAKLSYALPAAAYGAHALCAPARRPGWTALGAAPMLLIVALLAAAAPEAFRFEVIDFPARAPAEWYQRAAPAKLFWLTKALDALKFLALGAALPALVIGVWRRAPAPLPLLALAGLAAGLAPFPTWRQYLLPLLPPLFVMLALRWSSAPPRPGCRRVVWLMFAGAGLSLSVEALARAGAGGLPMLVAARESRAIGAAYRQSGARGPVVTLSPHYLPGARLAIDPRFAAGPFYFRARGLLTRAAEARLGLVSGAALNRVALGPVLLEGVAEEAALAAEVRARRYRAVPVAGTRFTLWLPRR